MTHESRITEADLVYPFMYALHRLGSRASMTDLYAGVLAYLSPVGEDLAQLTNRSDTKLSQKIRNLKSHNKLNPAFVTYTEGTYELTAAGAVDLFASDWYSALACSAGFQTADEAPQDTPDAAPQLNRGRKAAQRAPTRRRRVPWGDDEVIQREVTEGAVQQRCTRTRYRSQDLRAYARAYYQEQAEDKVLRCCVCGENAQDVFGIDADLVQIHHLKPIKEYAEEGETMTMRAAVQQTAPLCGFCHTAAHAVEPPYTPEELRDMRQTIRKKRGTPGREPHG